MRLAIDLDGTICDDEYPFFGCVKPGAREALTKLKAAGHYITIYSCRTGEELKSSKYDRADQVKKMEEFLTDNHIPFDEIYEGVGKPVADRYIDDRGIEYKDNWEEITERLTK
jgi:histidinol phosphatase-like enzyme